MYTFNSRVRYSETDPDGYLTTGSVIDYFQDCSTFQSEDLGIGISYLTKIHLAWLVNYWQIDITSLPRLGDEITIGTSPYAMKGFMGYRNFMIDGPDGYRYMKAYSVWSLMNMEKMLPERVPQLLQERYTLNPAFDMEYTSRKITVPRTDPVTGQSVVVDGSMLDSNHHVNNAQYVRMAARAAGVETIHEGRLRVEYMRQAHEGDVITPVCYQAEGAAVICLDAADGRPYAVIEIKKKS